LQSLLPLVAGGKLPGFCADSYIVGEG